jgi:hypothetical protein
MSRQPLQITACFLAALLAAGCGNGTQEAPPAAIDVCALLPRGDAERIFGVSLERADSPNDGTPRCSYFSAGEREFARAEVATVKARESFDGMLRLLRDEQPLSGVNAQSAYTTPGGALYLLRDGAFYRFMPMTGGADREQLRAIARIVSRNLPP